MHPNLRRTLLRSVFTAMVVCFFLPFTTLSCGGKTLTKLNGLQMAMGTTWEQEGPLGLSLKQKTTPPEPWAILAGLSALAGASLVWTRKKSAKLGVLIPSALSGLSLLLLKFKIDKEVAEQTQQALTVQWEAGYWLMLLAATAGVALALLPGTSDTGNSGG